MAIAHRLSTIAAMDRLVVMDHGRVVEDRRPQSLLAAGGIYARLWAHQSGGFWRGTTTTTRSPSSRRPAQAFSGRREMSSAAGWWCRSRRRPSSGGRWPRPARASRSRGSRRCLWAASSICSSTAGAGRRRPGRDPVRQRGGDLVPQRRHLLVEGQARALGLRQFAPKFADEAAVQHDAAHDAGDARRRPRRSTRSQCLPMTGCIGRRAAFLSAGAWPDRSRAQGAAATMQRLPLPAMKTETALAAPRALTAYRPFWAKRLRPRALPAHHPAGDGSARLGFVRRGRRHRRRLRRPPQLRHGGHRPRAGSAGLSRRHRRPARLDERRGPSALGGRTCSTASPPGTWTR